ncbi:UDP-glycosyltransferase 708G1-like [Euphorbia lathyris]|uniref:UDP-glycosyltransferase 708G1-like n=1 Tax=Euphorbia lathyris TaxID=212925 RepID=UPI003313328F
MSGSSNHNLPHIALLPSAGMGHLSPFLRLASLLSSHNLKVTIITPNPTVSLSESQTLLHFFTSFPQITQIPLHLLPSHNNQTTSSQDPFYNHMERIHHSSHLLLSLLPSLSPSLSALITDMSLTSSFLPITQSLNLPNYILFTSSAQMLTLFVKYHSIMDSIINSTHDDSLQIPFPRSWIPPPLLESTQNSLKTYIAENGKKMAASTGILVNTFQSIELSSLNNLNGGGVITTLPPVIAIGPLAPLIDEKQNQELTWLGSQPAGSVVYVSFGSRTAMSREQLRELGEGLVRSGSKFMWVVKDKKVDTEDEESLDKIIGGELMEKMKENGMVLKNWVNQEEVLRHESIGCFMSHCGWNSVTEAMWNGVRVLAWPQHGDQKMNADIVDKIGLGIWPKNWGWGGEMVVNGSEIAESIKEIMGNELLRVGALRIREEAKRAAELGGSSDKELRGLIETWKQAHVDVVV